MRMAAGALGEEGKARTTNAIELLVRLYGQVRGHTVLGFLRKGTSRFTDQPIDLAG
jgi:hypothetical protein